MVPGSRAPHAGAMDENEQTGPATGQPGTTTAPPTGGPRVSREQVRDVERLRRSTTDRYVAGVAGGLGRHLDVDPVVVRVVLAVLTLFGGAGVLLYAAVWLFVADDRSDRAPVELGPDARRVVLAVAAALALLIVFGSPFLDGRWSSPLPFLLLVVAGVVAWTTRRRDRRSAPPPAPWAGPPSAAAAAHPGAGSSTQTLPVTPSGAWPGDVRGASAAGSPVDPGGPTGQAPPRWTPPSAPLPPPRPRRTGVVLFWPTLALVAIALGTLGILDASRTVPASAYAALALTVTGLGLLVGAFVGRPGGLIALGLVTSLALGITGAVDAATGGSTRDEDVRAAPTSAAAVRDDYTIRTGSLTVDLSGVRDVRALDGRAVTVSGRAAEILVVLPPGLNADVAARVRYAGQVDLGTSSRGGFDFSTARTLTSSTAPGTPTIRLDLATRVGRITVEQR